MIDFILITHRLVKGTMEVYPKFIVRESKDLMIRGKDFYAIWDEKQQKWCTNEQDAVRIIDSYLDIYAEENKDKFNGYYVRTMHLWDADTGMIDKWHKYCQKQMWDNYHPLDEKIIFSNTPVKKSDYASKCLPYPLQSGPTDSFDSLMSVLYDKEEFDKLVWAIGAIISGDSKKIQKFIVLYGAAGTGKSTILNIVQMLFEGYYSVFDAKALGSATNVFALEAFKSNPLIAIQHDGDLSHIEDNTRINSVVSHEQMVINEKYKSTYSNSLNAFLFMGTNKPVKITDAKSGLLRRLIDVSPTGNTVPVDKYHELMGRIEFELGAIADKCLNFYLDNKHLYDGYVPISMLGASNDFYNFIVDSYFTFSQSQYTTLKSAWEMYKQYCDDARVSYPMSQRVFKEELKNYFDSFYERYTLPVSGERVRNIYFGFKEEQFGNKMENQQPSQYSLIFNSTHSLLDDLYSEALAQYAKEDGSPENFWNKVTTTLKDIDTSKLHYMLLPDNGTHIVIDFDKKDKQGNKSFEENLKEAAKFPPTYAELSKSGVGIHLHYYYDGDVNDLDNIFAPDIEIKVFKGKSALRRKVTRCNDIPIAHISSGLPIKKGDDTKTIQERRIKDENGLRNMILRNLNKEIHASTKCSIDFIDKILDDAYKSGMHYDVSDLKTKIFTFAGRSTNNAPYCLKKALEMKYSSSDTELNVESDGVIVFTDVEVYPNLFMLGYKLPGEDKEVVQLWNPKPNDLEWLIKQKIIGFNNRRYDNHIIWAAYLGYSVEDIYALSQKIIDKKNKDCFFGSAYNLSYTDIYDYCAKKQSLKKWEIELGIHHKELNIPWNEPVPKEKWYLVGEYNKNDVIATELVWNATQADFAARKILADLTGMTVNDTTNSLTTRLIFGNDKNPQYQFNYRDLSEPVLYSDSLNEKMGYDSTHKYRVFDNLGEPVFRDYIPGEKLPDGYSILPFFPEYTFENGYSKFADFDVGEGGLVIALPGMYPDVDLLDVESMHPHSVIAECLFGPEYTKRFKELVELRVAVKHRDIETISSYMNGALIKYLGDEKMMDSLAYALKIAINSVYGLTAAAFINAFRDNRNVDNIVAKRGALFMAKLANRVRSMGFTVAHIKTDSIKIPNATQEVIDFCMAYAKEFGYKFEHEARYNRMCLVNKAVYIAKYETAENCEKSLPYIPSDNKKHGGEWTATGTQFAVPYVFKTLFSHEDLVFSDYCETKSVKSSLYLDFNERLQDVSSYEEELDRRTSASKRKLNPLYSDMSDDDLRNYISKGHNYIFVGRVGSFCPVKKGTNGGELMREQDGKYYYAANTTGYRWKEAEIVDGDISQIDMSYFEKLADDAIKEISNYGDFNKFIS